MDDIIGRIYCHFLVILSGLNHRTAWVEKDHSEHLVSTPPCCVQGHQPLEQAAQSHVQPGLECLQGIITGFRDNADTSSPDRGRLLTPHLRAPTKSEVSPARLHSSYQQTKKATQNNLGNVLPHSSGFERTPILCYSLWSIICFAKAILT